MHQSHPTTRKAARGGFTLFEVVLSLGLASMILILMGAAIHVYFRVLDYDRTEVEEAQLARTLLQMIATDLRNTVKPDPQAAESEDGESEDGESSAIFEETDAFKASPVLGLFGDSSRLQMDIGRLPRANRRQMGGIKTVMYYVIDETNLLEGAASDAEKVRGLVRHELDRGTAIWSVEQGQLDEIEEELLPIAPEVARIEFRYSDGFGWFDQWDSVALGGLPVAVEIALAVTPYFNRDEDDAKLLVYRLLVRIPTAEAKAVGSLDEEAEEEY